MQRERLCAVLIVFQYFNRSEFVTNMALKKPDATFYAATDDAQCLQNFSNEIVAIILELSKLGG